MTRATILALMVSGLLLLVACGARGEATGNEGVAAEQAVDEEEAERVKAELSKTYDVDVQMIPIPDDPESVTRGEHIAYGWGSCVTCHGVASLDGGNHRLPYRDLFDVPVANLTPGEGGIGATYTDEDWVRTLRYGVKPDGTSVLAMPSYRYSNMSDEDLGALIAFLKTLPPKDSNSGILSVSPEATLVDLDDVSLLPARYIDHDAVRPASVEPAPTAEYGEYLVSASHCLGCHGEEMNGAELPYTPRGGPHPPASNLTPGGELAGWSEADFIETLRTGTNPAGHELDNQWMRPYVFKEMTGVELAAIFAYLQSLPAQETGY